MPSIIKKFLPVVIVFLTLATGIKWLLGNAAGPPDDRVKAPNESTGDNLGCATSGCHSAASVTDGSADISISGLPAQYLPGATYSLTFTISNDVAGNNGFEVTASSGGASRVGIWSNAGANSIISGQYWKHNGTQTNTSWTVDWTAPSVNIGTITFYAGANKGGAASGGNLHFNSWAVPPATLLNPYNTTKTTTTLSYQWNNIGGVNYIAALSTTSNFSVNTASITLSANSTTFANLSVSTTYFFKVKISTESDSAYNVPLATSTRKNPAILGTPPAGVTNRSSSTISIQWLPNFNSPDTSYEVAYSTVSGIESFPSFAVFQATFGTLINLMPDNTYYFHIHTIDVDGGQLPKDVDLSTMTLAGDITAPGQVTGFAAYQSGTPNVVRLEWITPGDDGYSGTLPVGSEYQIQYSTFSDFSIAWSTVTISTSGVVPGLLVGATVQPALNELYYFRIRAKDEAGNFGTLSANATAFNSPYTLSTIDSAGDVGLFASIAIDGSGNPHISYRDATNADLKYAKWTGASWSVETVDSAGDVGEYTSIAIDASGNPHISYRDSTNTDLKYAKWTGTSWSTQTVDSAGDVGLYASITIDGSGNPHISYYDATNTDLKYAKWNGVSWSTQTVDSAGDVGLYTSIAIDGSGNPHISYRDAINDDLKYAKWTGTSWSTQTVDSAGNLGSFTSIALDGENRPHISYIDIANIDIKYAKWTGTSWSTQTVDSAGNLGSYTSIALDGSGNVHISYYDNTNADLKYAKWTGAGFAAPMGGNARGKVQAPTSFRVESSEFGVSSITWRWNDNASNELGYRVYFSSYNRGRDDFALAADTNTLGPNSVSWAQTGLTPNTSYQAYVAAVNLGGVVTSSSTTKYTLAAVPTNSFATAVNQTSITVSWLANGNPSYTEYEVQRSTDAGFSILNAGFTTSLSTNIQNLIPNTSYYFRVRARNQENIFTLFDTAFSTKTLPPPPPGMISTFTALSGVWSNPSNWDPASVPTDGKFVVIQGSATLDTNTANLTGIYVLAGATITPAGSGYVINISSNPAGLPPGMDEIKVDGRILGQGPNAIKIVVGNGSTSMTKKILGAFPTLPNPESNIEIQNNATLLAQSDISIGTMAILSGGTFDTSNRTIRVRRNWVQNGIFLGAGSDVRFEQGAAGAVQTISGNGCGGSVCFDTVTINNGANNQTQTLSPLDINGKFTLISGTFSAAGAFEHTFRGDFIQNGGHMQGFNNSTFTFSGASGQTINRTGGTGNNSNLALKIGNTSTGGVTFLTDQQVSLFSCSSASAKLFFNAGSTYTFTELRLNGGGTGSRIQLRPTASNPPVFFNVSQASVSYVDVSSNHATGVTINASAGSLDSGNNVNWTFGGGGGGGGTVNFSFSGDFNSPGGAVIASQNNQAEIGHHVLIDTVTGGGPYYYVLFHSTNGTTGVSPDIAGIARYNASGVMLSSSILSGNVSGDGFALDNAGNVYVGERSGQGADKKIWISKYSNNLVFVSSVSVSTNAVGNITRMVSDGTFLYTNNDDGNSGSAKVIKYNSSLIAVATASYVIGGTNNGNSIVLDGAGNVYVAVATASGTGATRHLVKYDNSLVQLTFKDATSLLPEEPELAVTGSNLYAVTQSSDTAYVHKFDLSLNYTGITSTITNLRPGTFLPNIKKGPDGNLYVSGTNKASSGFGDYVVWKLDQNLVMLTSATFNGSANGGDVTVNLAVLDSSNVFVTGSSYNGSNDDAVTVKLNLSSGGGGGGASTNLNVSFTDVQQSSLTVNWTIVSGSSYTGALALDSGFSSIVSSGLLTTPPTTYSGLNPGTQYFFRMKISTEPDSAYNSPISTFTKSAPPPTATFVTVASSVDYSATSDNNARRLARDSSGNMFIAYAKNYGGNSQIFVAKSVDNGKTWQDVPNSSQPVVNISGYWQDEPTLAIDSANRLHLLWQGGDSTYNQYQIKYMRSSDGGASWTSWTNIQPISGYYQYNPSLAVDSNNNLHVVWYGNDGTNTSNYVIKYSKSSDNGNSWSAPQNIGVAGSYSQYNPAIAVDLNNNLHVVWYGYDSANASYSQIKYAKSTNNGGTWDAWQNIQVISNYSQWYPSLAIDNANAIHVTWSGYDAVESSNTQIKYTRSTNGGASWDPWKNVSVVPSYWQERPSIAIGSQDRLFIFWHGQDSGSSGYSQIKMSSSTDIGATWSPWKNMTNAMNSQQYASARWSMFHNGGGAGNNLNWTWTGYDNTISNYRVYYASTSHTMSAGGTPPPPAPTNVRFSTATASAPWEVTAKWDLITGNQYTVAFGTHNGFAPGTILSSGTIGLNAAVTTYINLSSGTVYWFKVKLSTHADQSYSVPISTVLGGGAVGAGSISGTLNYIGETGAGNFYVRLSTLPTMNAPPAPGQSDKMLTSTGSFTFNLVGNGTYYIRAWRDSFNADAQYNMDEPVGAHGSFATQVQDSVNNAITPIVISGAQNITDKVVNVYDHNNLPVNLTKTGNLTSTGTVAVERGLDKYGAWYNFNGQSGQTVTIDLIAQNTNWDTYLYLFNPNGTLATFDDDGAGNGNSRILNYTLSKDGPHHILATSYGNPALPVSFNINLSISGGAQSVSGNISYSGGASGPYIVQASTVPEFTTIFRSSNTGTLTTYTLSPMTGGQGYFIRAFKDSNANGNPNGIEPVGGVNRPGKNESEFVFVPATDSLSGINITIEDTGRVTGFISKTSTQTGNIRIKFDNFSCVSGTNTFFADVPASTGTYFIDLLRPASCYAITAYVDGNNSLTLESFEDRGSTIPVNVAGGVVTSGADITIGGVGAPPTPTNFSGTAISTSAIRWTWTDVGGETGYRLKNQFGSVIATLGANATSYIESGFTEGNSSSTITQVVAFNDSGESPSNWAVTYPIYTLARVPGIPTFIGVGQSTIGVSWSANNNASGTRFNLFRATSATANFGFVLSTTATSVIDSGLVPLTTYFYKLYARNGNDIASAFGGVNNTTTTAGTGNSIAGNISYAGKQPGVIRVQYATDPSFSGAQNIILPVVSSQNYYLGGVSPGNWYVRAFVDVEAGAKYSDNILQPGEDFGNFGGTTPVAINVAGAEIGKNFAISVDTVTPGAPFNLSGNFTAGSISLYWSAPADIDLWGYEIQKLSGGVFQTIAGSTNSPSVGASYNDNSPAPGDNTYRVRAIDWGRNSSIWSQNVTVNVSSSGGGSISGTVEFRGETTSSNNYILRLSTSSSPNASSIQEISISTLPPASFTFSGVTDGNYFLRGFWDTNNNGTWDKATEPVGADGPFANPFPIFVTGGQQVTGKIVTLSNRTQLTVPGGQNSITVSGHLVSSGPNAMERGPGYYGRYYTFSGVQGQKVTIRMNATGNSVAKPGVNNWDTYLYLLGPNGGIAATDDDSDGNLDARIHDIFSSTTPFTLPETGVYHILATAYGTGIDGTFNLTLQLQGGFTGSISGNISYSGSQAGDFQLLLFESANSNFPVQTKTQASTGSYSFTGLKDETYTLKVFKDVNFNGFKDPGEPEASLSGLSISGGNQLSGQNLSFEDKKFGTAIGTITYTGSATSYPLVIQGLRSTSPLVVEVTTRIAPTVSYPKQFTLQKLSTASASYIVRAFIDKNDNSSLDFLEPAGQYSGITIADKSTTSGVNFTVFDAGASGASGIGSITGNISYSGSATGALWVGIAADDQFRDVRYSTIIAAPGVYVATGIADGTYYVGGFRDKNGNGFFDGDDPSGRYGDGTNAIAVVVASTEMANINFVMIDKSTGSISGSITYNGAANGNIRVEAFSVAAEGIPAYFGEKVILRPPFNTGTTNYSIPFLASANDYKVVAWIDGNDNKQWDPGESGTELLNVQVNTNTAVTTGINLVIFDPGQSQNGRVTGSIAYSGSAPGDFRIRLFTSNSFAGAPAYSIVRSTTGAFTIDNVAPNVTYYIDAFKDSNFSFSFDPAYEAYASLPNTPIWIRASALYQEIGTMTVQDAATGIIIGPNNVSGTVVNRSGITSGRLFVELMIATATVETLPTARQDFILPVTSVTYSFSPPDGDYFLRAWIDTNNNFAPDPTEPMGRRPVGGMFGGVQLSSRNFEVASRTLLPAGTELFATLSSTDARSADRGSGNYFADYYYFTAARGEQVTIEMVASGFSNTYLYLVGPAGELLTFDDDGAGNLNSRIFNYTINSAGVHTVIATSYGVGATGSYRISRSGATGSISGAVSYTGTQGGNIRVGLFNSIPSPNAIPIQGVLLPGPTNYTFADIASNVTYYVGAFVDANFNTFPDQGEDFGIYGTTTAGQPPVGIFLSANQNFTNANFTILSATTGVPGISQEGLIQGQLTYNGTQSGPVNVEIWNTATFTGAPVANRRIDPFSSPQFYEVRVPQGNYYLKAWMDANRNFIFDPLTEPEGRYTLSATGADQVYVTANSTATGVNITLRDRNEVIGSTTTFRGEGTATIVPSTGSAGESLTNGATISVVVGANGIRANGKISVTWPFGMWPSYFRSDINPGAPQEWESIVQTTGTITGTVQTFDRTVTLTVNSGQMTGNTLVRFIWKGAWLGCEVSTKTFTIATVSDGGAAPAAIASQPTFEVRQGVARNIAFGEGWLTMSVNTSTTNPQAVYALQDALPVTVQLKDNCFNTVKATYNVTVNPSATVWNPQTYVTMSTNTLLFSTRTVSLGGVTVATGPWLDSSTFTIPTNRSSATVYLAATLQGSKNIRIRSSVAPWDNYAGVSVLAGQALTDVSISTSPSPSPGNSSLTMNPAGGLGQNAAFIHFRTGDPFASWRVAIASTAWPSTEEMLAGRTPPNAVWETFGWGIPQFPVAWDGRFSPWINFGAVVPSGLYYVRIELVGSSIRNDSLSITVSVPALSGSVSDAANSLQKLSDVRVEAFGPTGFGVGFTNSNGNYTIPGLTPGIYNVRFAKSGYVERSTSTTVTSQGGTQNMQLSQASALRITGSVNPAATQEQWGNITVRTSNWSRSYFASMRVQNGRTIIDDGGRWDFASQQFVTRDFIRIEVETGTYVVEAELFGFGRSSQTVLVTSTDGVKNITIPTFTRRANVSGNVFINPAGVRLPQYGVWVSVEAKPVVSTGTPYYGGAWLPNYNNVQSTFGAYTLFGLEQGSYTLTARTEGLRSTSTLVYVGDTDLNGIDISTLSAAGELTGSITIFASTVIVRGQSDYEAGTNDGRLPNEIGLRFDVNFWSPQNYSNAFVSVYVPTTNLVANSYQNVDGSSWTTLTGTYSVKGLSPGTYNIYPRKGHNPWWWIPSATNPATVTYDGSSGTVPTLTYTQNTGLLKFWVILPPGATDFENAIFQFNKLTGDPFFIGGEGSNQNTRLVSFPVKGFKNNVNDGFSKEDLNGSTATIIAGGLDTSEMDIALTYRPTGQTIRRRLSYIQNQSVELSTFDFRPQLVPQLYQITGTIENAVSDTNFDTFEEIIDPVNGGTHRWNNPTGYPADISSTTARVQAVKRDVSNANQALVTTQFDPINTRVGFITAAGTYSISGLTPGTWIVHTLDIKDSSGNVVIPRQEQTITIVNSSPTVNFRLTSGFTISGSISFADSKQDARNIRITVRNRRGEVVRSTNTTIGNPFTGETGNSVNYSFSGIPAGQVYTVSVRDLGIPTSPLLKYVARPIRVPDTAADPTGAGLQGNLSNQNITFREGGAVRAKLRDANSGSVITSRNKSLLPPTFTIYAIANPWVDGGFTELRSTNAALTAARDIIGEDGSFTLGPLVPDIAYDIHFEQSTWDLAYTAQGAQNYSPVVVAGVSVREAEVRDLGTQDLKQGTEVNGTITVENATTTLSNVLVRAVPALVESNFKIEVRTDLNGRFKLWLSTYLARYYDITAAPRAEGEQVAEIGGNLFAQKTLRLDLTRQTTADFALSPANFSVSGKVNTQDGGQLKIPYGESTGFPGAAVVMQSSGVPPSGTNPLGDIIGYTDGEGNFTIPRLRAGKYNLYGVSQDYTIAYKFVEITNTNVNIGTVTLNRSASVTGTIRKPDSTSSSGFAAVSNKEVNAVAAANQTLSAFLYGTVEIDAEAKTVSKYTISGFVPGQKYIIVFFPENKDDDLVFAQTEDGELAEITFSADESTATKTTNLIYKPVLAEVEAKIKKLGNDQYQIKFEVTKALRNKTGTDNDLDAIVTKVSSGTDSDKISDGKLLGQQDGKEKELSGDRKQVTVIYDAKKDGQQNGAVDNAFILRFKAFTSIRNPSTGEDFEIDKTFVFYTGVDAESRGRVSNARGGGVEMEATGDEQENTGVTFDAGTFVNEGDLTPNPTSQATVGIGRARDVETSTRTSQARGAPSAPGVVEEEEPLPTNLPPALAKAMRAMRKIQRASSSSIAGESGGEGSIKGAPLSAPATSAAQVAQNVLGAFYDFFLPAGVKRQLAKNAKITLQYSTAAGNVDDMNVYFFNDSTGPMYTTPNSQSTGTLVPPGAYGLENTNRTLDPINKTISVSVNHFTVFVVVNATSTSLGAAQVVQQSADSPQADDAQPWSFNSGAVNTFNLTLGTTRQVTGIPVSGGGTETHSFTLISTGSGNNNLKVNVQSHLQTLTLSVGEEKLLNLNDQLDNSNDVSFKVVGFLAANRAQVSLASLLALALPQTVDYTGTEILAFNLPNPFNPNENLNDKNIVGTKTLGQGRLKTDNACQCGTFIRYALPANLGTERVKAKLDIYDVAGELVASFDLKDTTDHGEPRTGKYHYTDWDGKNSAGQVVASGIYIGRISAGNMSKTFKMAVVK